MSWRLIMFVACIGTYFLQLPVRALPQNFLSLRVAQNSATCNEVKQSQPADEMAWPLLDDLTDLETLDLDSLKAIAKSVTVKVWAGKSWGSGILIRKQGQVYTVLTNDHVLTPGQKSEYRIQTPDNRTYAATMSAVKFNGNDLALVQFGSDATYKLATLAVGEILTPGEEVFASGFPFSSQGLVFTSGQISLILDRSLEQGYQIGYTNDVRKGMSGGPVLNSQGEVVAVNGMHSYPIWGNPYVFKDGSVPPVAMRKQMQQFSWAIPIQTFFCNWLADIRVKKLC